MNSDVSLQQIDGAEAGALEAAVVDAAEQTRDRWGGWMIAAGVIGLAIMALLIWPAAAAIKQAKALERHDKNPNTALAPAPAAPAARAINWAAAIVGGVFVGIAILGLVFGNKIAFSLGIVLAIALLIVGSVAVSKMDRFEPSGYPDSTRGVWAQAAAGLWITAMVLFLGVASLFAIISGSIILAK